MTPSARLQNSKAFLAGLARSRHQVSRLHKPFQSSYRFGNQLFRNRCSTGHMQRFFWLFEMPGVRKSEFSFVKLAMTMHAFETSSGYFFDSNDAKLLIEDKS